MKHHHPHKSCLLWFTYCNDFDYLLISLRVAQDTNEREKQQHVFCVIDDAENPFTSLQLTKLRAEFPNVDYQQSVFSRRRNLNGLECVQGILKTAETLCLKHKADSFVKIDSDTLVFSFNWITFSSAMSGFFSPSLGLYGCAYWLPLRTIKAIQKSIRQIGDSQKARFPEDATISWFALLYDGANVKVHFHASKLIGGWMYNEMQRERFRYTQIIHFAPPSSKLNLPFGQDHRLEAMKSFKEHIPLEQQQ